jgi:regulator of protease activity HflC (stomatin/prohibitin superfamily)
MSRYLSVIPLVLAFSAGCTATTESTEVGVRVVRASPFGVRGVEPEAYMPGGTYFFVRALSDWYVFDTALQNLVMVRETGEGARTGDDSLRFKTIDGNDVSVNVTVSWRIDPTAAPRILQFIGEDTRTVEEKFVRPVSRAVIRDLLNQLSSEAYYQADRRFVIAEDAKERLNTIFVHEGVVIEQVLLGEHRFNQDYEQIIRDKKVAEQESERLVSETEAASEEMKRDLETAKGGVSKALEAAGGQAAQRRIEADAIYFERQQQATAILAEKQARAQGLTEQARAMSGAGGEAMVKLAIARALQGKKILFMPAGEGMDVRTTDVNSLLKTYGVQAVAGGQ